MVKPLFRWTIGNPSLVGLEIFKESVKKTTQSLGINNFDWMICHNNLSEEQLKYIRKICDGKPIELKPQTPNDCPIPIQRPLKSMWKLCPPRMRLESHEIIIDNDVILSKPLEQIDEFLQSNKIIWLDEPNRCFGKYDDILDKSMVYNSGIIGLPPFYEFARNLVKTWIKYDAFEQLDYCDEQGLVALTLKDEDKIIINRMEIQLVCPYDTGMNFKNAKGYHFIVANRLDKHEGWDWYKRSKIKII